MKHVHMIACYYPRLSGSSGIQREALRRSMDAGLVAPVALCPRLRFSEQSDFPATMTLAHGNRDVLHLRLTVQCHAALAEMCPADGLFVLQSADCNDQIPGKVYEYVWANTPILERCGTVGYTAGVRNVAGSGKPAANTWRR